MINSEIPDEKEQLYIGEFRLVRTRSDKIWIAHESGEGGEFSEKLLADVIRAFYKEHF